MTADRSRRDVLKTTAALGATGLVTSLAGCQQVKDAVGVGTNHTKQVPEDAESAFYVDVRAALNDEGMRKLTNTYLDQISEREYYDGPESFEEVKEDFEDEANLDPSEAKWQLSFSEYGEYGVTSEYRGTIFTGNWDEDDVVDALEDNYERIDYDDDEHEGKTVYEPDEEYAPYLGVLSNNKFVTGSQDAVEDTIDVAKGEEDPMDEEYRKAYGNTRNAPVRWVGEMRTEFDDTTYVGGEEVDINPLKDVEIVAGSVYKNGSKRGTETTLVIGDEDNAKDVADTLDGIVSLMAQNEEAPDAVTEIMDETEVEREGADVVVSYEAEVSELTEMLEDAMDREETDTMSNLQAGASIAHDRSQEEIEVTWTSNQNADTLRIEFQGDDFETDYLYEVGDRTTYNCSAGEIVDVTVTAMADNQETVIVADTIEC